MKYLQRYNERLEIPKLFDLDNDGYMEVNLNNLNIILKENVLYEYLNVHFRINYNNVSKKYNVIIQYPDSSPDDGKEDYMGWVFYKKDITNINIKIKNEIIKYKKYYKI